MFIIFDNRVIPYTFEIMAEEIEKAIENDYDYTLVLPNDRGCGEHPFIRKSLLDPPTPNFGVIVRDRRLKPIKFDPEMISVMTYVSEKILSSNKVSSSIESNKKQFAVELEKLLDDETISPERRKIVKGLLESSKK